MSNLLEDLGLTLEDLKVVAEARGIKNYESMSEDELLSALNTCCCVNSTYYNCTLLPLVY